MIGAYDIDSGDVRVNAQRHVDALHLGPILGIIQHLLARNHACFQDMLIVIDVVQEHVERLDTLLETLLQARPFMRRKNPGHDVKRDRALGAVVVAVDRKRNAHTPKDELGLVASRAQSLFRLVREPVCKILVVRSDLVGGANGLNGAISASIHHFVKSGCLRLLLHQGTCHAFIKKVTSLTCHVAQKDFEFVQFKQYLCQMVRFSLLWHRYCLMRIICLSMSHSIT